MANLPIDTARIALIATGKVRPVRMYAEDATGEKRLVPGSHEKDEKSGLPVWTIDVQLDDDDAARAEAVGVKVPAAQEPTPAKWQPVLFEGLNCSPYVDKVTKRVAFSMRAKGIVSAPTGRAPKTEG